MAARSPSPNSSRPSAHNPRTPDSSLSIRKSKEMPQRVSLSKPTSLSPRSSFEQKENVKSRSPAVSKGSKNFMVPTISAASKAVPPSPRKRILHDRNEVTDWVSNSFEFLVKELGSGVEIDEIGSKSETGKSQEVLSCGEVKRGDSRIKNRQNVIVPSLSPLDADPLLPPYDPKTNYLSPRPQFLHYRPNPRIENHLNQEGEFLDVGDGKLLEDSFSLDSGEDDASVLAEEKDSEEESYPTKVEEDEELEEVESPCKTLLSEPEFKIEFEESCPVEVVKVEELEEVESPVRTLASRPEFKSESLKRRPFRRPKMVAFLFVLIMASLYAPLSDSPIISSFILKDQSPSKPYTPSFGVIQDYFAVVNENFLGLGSRFRDWSADPISSFTYVTSPLKDDIGLQLLVNVTSLPVDGEPVTEEAIQAVAEAETEQVLKNNGVHELPFALHEFEAETEQVVALHQPGLSEVVTEDDAGVMELEEVLDENTETMGYSKSKQVIQDNGVEELFFTVHQSAVTEVVKEVDAEYSAGELEMQILEENAELIVEDEEIGMVGRNMESEKIEMVVSEDVKEDDVGALGIEMEISEEMIDEGRVGYELEKEVVEDGRSIELDCSEAVHVKEDGKNTGIEYTQTHYDLEAEPEIIGGEGDGSNVNSDDQSDLSSDDQSELRADEIISHGHEHMKSMNYRTMLGLSLAPLVLSAALVFLYKKQRQGPMIEKERKTTRKLGSVSNGSQTCAPTRGNSEQNLQRDGGVIGDSGSSMVGCSWNDTSNSGQRQTRSYKDEQNLSEERRLRRDSAASSSSISYGSFTTYERLSAKKVGRDVEVVTPVRRSSRIKSIVT